MSAPRLPVSDFPLSGRTLPQPHGLLPGHSPASWSWRSVRVHPRHGNLEHPVDSEPPSFFDKKALTSLNAGPRLPRRNSSARTVVVRAASSGGVDQSEEERRAGRGRSFEAASRNQGPNSADFAPLSSGDGSRDAPEGSWLPGAAAAAVLGAGFLVLAIASQKKGPVVPQQPAPAVSTSSSSSTSGAAAGNVGAGRAEGEAGAKGPQARGDAGEGASGAGQSSADHSKSRGQASGSGVEEGGAPLVPSQSPRHGQAEVHAVLPHIAQPQMSIQVAVKRVPASRDVDPVQGGRAEGRPRDASTAHLEAEQYEPERKAGNPEAYNVAGRRGARGPEADELAGRSWRESAAAPSPPSSGALIPQFTRSASREAWDAAEALDPGPAFGAVFVPAPVDMGGPPMEFGEEAVARRKQQKDGFAKRLLARLSAVAGRAQAESKADPSVLVQPAVETAQSQAVSALQSLQVLDDGLDPAEICTRRQFARWLVRASSALTSRPSQRILPAMFMEGVTDIAYDDVPPSDPDFPAIQGLAETGLVGSKLSLRDLGCPRYVQEPLQPAQKQQRSLFGARLSGPDQEFGAEPLGPITALAHPVRLGCNTDSFFRPDGALTRQDLISWVVALQQVDKTTEDHLDQQASGLKKVSSFLDTPSINSDALSAVALDLGRGDDSIFHTVFGVSRRFDPHKPVTCGQVAVALSLGDSSAAEAVEGELERMHGGETVAPKAAEPESQPNAAGEREAGGAEKDLASWAVLLTEKTKDALREQQALIASLLQQLQSQPGATTKLSPGEGNPPGAESSQGHVVPLEKPHSEQQGPVVLVPEPQQEQAKPQLAAPVRVDVQQDGTAAREPLEVADGTVSKGRAWGLGGLLRRAERAPLSSSGAAEQGKEAAAGEAREAGATSSSADQAKEVKERAAPGEAGLEVAVLAGRGEGAELPKQDHVRVIKEKLKEQAAALVQLIRRLKLRSRARQVGVQALTHARRAGAAARDAFWRAARAGRRRLDAWTEQRASQLLQPGSSAEPKSAGLGGPGPRDEKPSTGKGAWQLGAWMRLRPGGSAEPKVAGQESLPSAREAPSSSRAGGFDAARFLPEFPSRKREGGTGDVPKIGIQEVIHKGHEEAETAASWTYARELAAQKWSQVQDAFTRLFKPS